MGLFDFFTDKLTEKVTETATEKFHDLTVGKLERGAGRLAERMVDRGTQHLAEAAGRQSAAHFGMETALPEGMTLDQVQASMLARIDPDDLADATSEE